MDKLILLGTGTCVIDSKRMGSSVLIDTEEFKVVYDFGRGTTTRLLEAGYKSDDIKYIIISHYHPDHFSDLIPFLQAAIHALGGHLADPRTKDLHIYGAHGLEKIMSNLFPLVSENFLKKANFDVQLHEIDIDSFKIKDMEFTPAELPHAGNRGIKFLLNDKVVALTGDTSFCDEVIVFLKDVDIAVIDSGHSTDEEIIEIAVQSNARKVYCTHLYRELDELFLNSEAVNKGYGGELLVGYDLMEIVP